jgi:hypothetical protein
LAVSHFVEGIERVLDLRDRIDNFDENWRVWRVLRYHEAAEGRMFGTSPAKRIAIDLRRGEVTSDMRSVREGLS